MGHWGLSYTSLGYQEKWRKDEFKMRYWTACSQMWMDVLWFNFSEGGKRTLRILGERLELYHQGITLSAYSACHWWTGTDKSWHCANARQHSRPLGWVDNAITLRPQWIFDTTVARIQAIVEANRGHTLFCNHTKSKEIILNLEVAIKTHKTSYPVKCPHILFSELLYIVTHYLLSPLCNPWYWQNCSWSCCWKMEMLACLLEGEVAAGLGLACTPAKQASYIFWYIAWGLVK